MLLLELLRIEMVGFDSGTAQYRSDDYLLMHIKAQNNIT